VPNPPLVIRADKNIAIPIVMKATAKDAHPAAEPPINNKTIPRKNIAQQGSNGIFKDSKSVVIDNIASQRMSPAEIEAVRFLYLKRTNKGKRIGRIILMPLRYCLSSHVREYSRESHFERHTLIVRYSKLAISIGKMIKSDMILPTFYLPAILKALKTFSEMFRY
jgi:hypothetical protein